MEDYNENEEVQQEEAVVQGNDENFDDLWDAEKDAKEEEESEETQETDEESVEGEESEEDKEQEEEEVEEDAIELELVEDADEALVGNVEILLSTDQLMLSPEQVKEIFNGTEESYTELLQANKEATTNMAIQSVYETLPQRGKDFFNYLIEMNGTGDIDGWLELESKAKDLSAFDIKSLTDDQAKAIVQQDNEAKGITGKKNKFIIEALEDEGDLVTEAKSILKAKNLEVEKQKAEKIASDKQRAKELEAAAVARQNSILQEINNTKFAKNKQEEMWNLIYGKSQNSEQPVIVEKLAHILQNKPKHVVQLAQLFDGYTEDGGFSFDRVKKQLKTEVTKKTKRTIKRSTKSSIKGGTTRNSKNNNTASLDDWLDGAQL